MLQTVMSFETSCDEARLAGYMSGCSMQTTQLHRP